ncbi:MAG TPA: GGDEF domain-containing protein [Deltaproteobacteria bacterium]|nr:GGDEF domain-containing protein [Deltaproteobacteria bacterium]
MFVRQISSQEIKKEIIAGEYNQSGTLALFTESMVALLSSRNSHQAFMDLVSLMGQTFPLSAPALYIDNMGFHARVYTMIERTVGGDHETRKILGTKACSYNKVLVGGHPPIIHHRIEFLLMSTPGTKIVLCINSGIHDDIFREWVKILTPAVAKLIDHEMLMHMAYRDGLTSLLNYRAFEEMLKAEQDRASRYDTTFSVMMIDIDHFKRINDTLGHPLGDVVLKTLSEKLTECVRKSDRVFRYGGEEFAVILPHTGLAKARKLAERIRLTIEKMRFIAGLHVTVSIGICQYNDGLTSDDLVKQADRGLYLAKNQGRNRIGIMKDIS